MSSDLKASIERDITQSRSTWETIVKYSFAANGTALGLSIGALSKLSGHVPIAQIGKAPLIIFFIGMIFSGFYLLFSYVLHIWSARESIDVKIAELTSERDKAREQLKSDHIISPEFASTSAKLDSLIVAISTINEIDKPANLIDVKTAAEVSIFLSYVCFFIGVVVVIWRI